MIIQPNSKKPLDLSPIPSVERSPDRPPHETIRTQRQRPDTRHERIIQALKPLAITVQLDMIQGRLCIRVIAKREAARRVA